MITTDDIKLATEQLAKGVASTPFIAKIVEEYVKETGHRDTIDTIIDYYQRKFNIVLWINKSNQLLKVFNYEEIINSSVCNSEESCTECESPSSEKEQNLCQSTGLNGGNQGTGS